MKKYVCIGVCLLLAACGGAWARPSVAEGATDNLLDRNTLLNGCPSSRPATFPAPSQILGDYCGLTNPGPEASVIPDSCSRHRFSAEGAKLKMSIITLHDGHTNRTQVMEFSRLPNDSWLISGAGHVLNYFVGYSADGQYLYLCGTTAPLGVRPEEVYGVALAKCMEPGDEALAAAGKRPLVTRCNFVTN